MQSVTRLSNEPEYMKIAPKHLHEFREVSPTEEIKIPAEPENRKCTDVYWHIPVVLNILFWITCAIAGGLTIDVKRIVKGVDECGNICGENNIEVVSEDCDAKNYTDSPYNIYEEGLACVKECGESRRLIFNRCVDENNKTFMFAVLLLLCMDTLFKSGITILTLIGIAFALSIVVLIAYRFFTTVTYWFFIIIIVALWAAWAGLSWFWYLQKQTSTMLAAAIILTILALAFTGVIIYTIMSERYTNIIPLIKEASLAIFKIPVLLIFPLTSVLVVFAMYIYMFYMLLVFVGHTSDKITGASTADMPIVLFIFWFHFAIVVCMLMIAIMNGFQCMVVAGSVAAYFFTKDKDTVNNRVFFNSLYVTFRYHLGTVAVGSLFVQTLSTTREMTHIARHYMQGRVLFSCCYHCIHCCTSHMEEIAQYVAKRAYILSAMHGKGIYKSGQRAARLLWYIFMDNVMVEITACDTMNCTGVAILLATMLTSLVLCGGDLINSFLAFFVVGVYVITVLLFYISLMNIAIVTIYLCACEDIILSDRQHKRPYFMSPELTNVMQRITENAARLQLKREERFLYETS